MGRTTRLSLLFLLLVAVVEVWVFTRETVNRRVKALRLHVFALQELLTFLLVWYIWSRVGYLFKPADWFSLNSVVRLVFVTILGFAQCCIILGVVFVGQEPAYVTSISNACLGIVIFMFTALVVTDALSLLVRKLLCRGVEWKKLMSANSEIQLRTSLALLISVALTFAGFVGISRFTVERLTIPVQGLAPSLNGMTILQLSDIHLGGFSGRRALQRIVDEVNVLEADVVVITGDLVDSSVQDLSAALLPLNSIRSKHGVFFVTGVCMHFNAALMLHSPSIGINILHIRSEFNNSHFTIVNYSKMSFKCESLKIVDCEFFLRSQSTNAYERNNNNYITHDKCNN